MKKNFLIKLSLLSISSLLFCSTSAIAQESLTEESIDLQSQITLPEGDAFEQITNVSQLRDVSPGDWAYDALRNLVENYDCLEGYPNRTYRGDRALTRYEFAAGLNACLDSISALMVNGGTLDPAELDQLRRLVNQFDAELTTLGTRVDNLEGRVAFLEDNQFSTTTKLVGELAFTLADAFGTDTSANTVLHDRLRLQLVSSFTGDDVLYTRLTAGNIGTSFAPQLGTNEGRFAFDGNANNNVTIDRLHYYFPVGDNLKVHLMPSLGGHHFYANTLNPGLEVGGGANGSLSRLGERNPIYRQGLGGAGAGLRFYLSDNVEGSVGYIAPGGNTPGEDAGLFNGDYSAMGQLVLKPSDDIQFGLTYVHSYSGNNATGRNFGFGGTGTDLGNLNFGDPNVTTNIGSLNAGTNPVSSNSYGVEAQWDVSPKFSLRAWGGFTDAILHGIGDAEIWNYSLVMAFPDLGKEGNLGAIVVGTEPYAGNIDISWWCNWF